MNERYIQIGSRMIALAAISHVELQSPHDGAKGDDGSKGVTVQMMGGAALHFCRTENCTALRRYFQGLSRGVVVNLTPQAARKGTAR